MTLKGKGNEIKRDLAPVMGVKNRVISMLFTFFHFSYMARRALTAAVRGWACIRDDAVDVRVAHARKAQETDVSFSVARGARPSRNEASAVAPGMPSGP